MPIKKIIFKILRFKPGLIDPPRFQEFELELAPNNSVLDGLEKIRVEQDPTLMYRRSCHHSSCGTCACLINGVERLTCITRIHELDCRTITLTPLEGFKTLGDLVVDMKSFYADLSEDWTYLKKIEEGSATNLPQGIIQFTRFENCIECGACISACPASHKNTIFLGPAVLAVLNCELKKSTREAKNLLAVAAGKRGEHLCERALNCSRVCPTGVYPARHIEDLRRLIKQRNSDKAENRK
jgi:succinate dehydrogenase / fumarate reductase iron-sulfur subunit